MGLLDPPGFRRNRHGQVWLHLPDTERTLMRSLLDQLGQLLASEEPQEPDRPMDPLEAMVGIEPSAERPSDPALARLFPDAYDDPELADEFRRFTQRDLRSSKLENQRTALATLDRPDPTQLSAEECHAWLAALNDLRLTLGTRLEVTEDGADQFADLPEDDPRRALYVVYDWLTYHQDRLVHALEKGLRP
jgi:Domain of unknown function (DUF2017)